MEEENKLMGGNTKKEMEGIQNSLKISSKWVEGHFWKANFFISPFL